MKDFSEFWKQEYSQKNPVIYPYDSVVTFVFRNYPKNKARKDVKILEVGCGGGNNLWFAAREGFNVTGLDCSEQAITFAKERFQKEGLKGDFRIGSFTDLPFMDEQFDLVIDRAAITCIGGKYSQIAIKEIKRVLTPQGFFFFNPYSERHSSFLSGELDSDGTKSDMTVGSIKGVDGIYFYNRKEINAIFSESTWQIKNCTHVEWQDLTLPHYTTHAEWRVTVQKD